MALFIRYIRAASLEKLRWDPSDAVNFRIFSARHLVQFRSYEVSERMWNCSCFAAPSLVGFYNHLLIAGPSRRQLRFRRDCPPRSDACQWGSDVLFRPASSMPQLKVEVLEAQVRIELTNKGFADPLIRALVRLRSIFALFFVTPFGKMKGPITVRALH